MADKLRKLSHNHLAEGEATGHYHAAIGDGVELWGNETETEKGVTRMHVKAPNGADVTHQEHNAFTIPAGDYDRIIVLEQDHAEDEVRAVAD